MNCDGLEPRTAMMAVAEVRWEDQTGTRHRAAARLEDASLSGACIRVKVPLAVGSKLTVKWQWEEFAGVVRNCRGDGREFLLGIRRDMARRSIEPELPPTGGAFERATGLASAELSWEGQDGTVYHASATIESRSAFEWCLRLGTPITAGVTLKIQCPAGQFSGVAKYCRWEGKAYLLGIQHEAGTSPAQRDPLSRRPIETLAPSSSAEVQSAPAKQEAAQNGSHARSSSPEPVQVSNPSVPVETQYSLANSSGFAGQAEDKRAQGSEMVRCTKFQTQSSSPRHERKFMRSKKLFPEFWGHPQNDTDTPGNGTHTEVPVNKMQANLAESLAAPQGDLLSCEDIYHASGILGARSGYGITKIIEMLNSKHIRELSKDVKRASVLMALDAAGTTVDDVLQDAARRQHALNSYEAGQQKQFEEFEARVARENAHLQAELERVTAHYAERIKHNLDQVAREKEAFHKWRTMKEQEAQRITEAVGLCAKPPAPETQPEGITALTAPRVPVGSA